MLSVKELSGYWQKITWNLSCIDVELIFLKRCPHHVNSVFKILQWLTFAISVLHNLFPTTSSIGNFTEYRGKLTSILVAERGWLRGPLCGKPYSAAPSEERAIYWKTLASCTKWKILTLAFKLFHHLPANLTINLFLLLLPYMTLLLFQLFIHSMQNNHCTLRSL